MKNKNNTIRQALAVLRREDGLTLIELLVVLAILVAVAGIASSTLSGVDQDTRAELTRTEMMQIAAAIRQFRQDTGYYPKQGIFDHEDNGGQADVTAADPDPAADLDKFESPANFSQLFIQPTTDGAAPNIVANVCTNCVLAFDVNTGRGWRGPYLKQESLADVGDGLDPTGAGDPGLGNDIKYLLGVADPQEFTPECIAGDEENVANTNCVLDWRPPPTPFPLTDPPLQLAFETHGRPFLYFIDPLAGTNAVPGTVAGCAVPCLVALGANGVYEQGGPDDIVVSVN